MTDLSLPFLLSRVRQIYPARDDPSVAADEYSKPPALKETVERTGREMRPQWDLLVAVIHKKAPALTLWDHTYLPLEPSFRLRTYRPDLPPELARADPLVCSAPVVLLVSVIVPAHHIYLALERRDGRRNLGSVVRNEGPWPAEQEADARTLDAAASELMGTTRIPIGLLSEPVPNLCCGASTPGSSLLGEFLFGGHWW